MRVLKSERIGNVCGWQKHTDKEKKERVSCCCCCHDVDKKIDGPADAAAVVVVVDVDVGHCPPFGGNGGTLILFFISLLFPQN